jgi:hypothetical protein
MISEVDINDFEQLPVELLYKLPNNSYIKMPATDYVLHFDHIDGMYSYCTNMFGDVCHIAAFTPVIPLVKKTNSPTK